MKKFFLLLAYMVSWQTCYTDGHCIWSTTSGLFAPEGVGSYVQQLLANPQVKVIKIEAVKK